MSDLVDYKMDVPLASKKDSGKIVIILKTFTLILVVELMFRSL
jgi:hypothetical protein